MKTVKALQTLHGNYGLKTTGDVFDVADSIAAQLVNNKLVELVEDKSTDTKTAQQLQEESTVAKNAAIDQKKAAAPAPTPAPVTKPAEASKATEVKK